MKYLNDDTLYFSSSLFGTPKNENTKYELDVYVGINGASYPVAYRTYIGYFFYWSNTQKIDYGFLLKNLHSDLDWHTFAASVTSQYTNSVVNVVLKDGGGTALGNSDTLLIERSRTPNGLDDTSYGWTTTTTNKVAIPIPTNVETPRFGPSMRFPVAVYTMQGELNGISVQTNQSTPRTWTVRNGNNSASASVPNYTRQCNTLLIDNTGTSDITISSTGISQKFKFDCDARYFLIWYDNLGYWQSQPFYGKANFSTTSGLVENNGTETTKYQTQVTPSWNLQSDWVHKPETYKGLLTSRNVVLYDSEATSDQYQKVIVKTTSYAENLSREPFRFEVELEATRDTLFK